MMEKFERIQKLRETSKAFFDKSLACTKLVDVKAFFELATQADDRANTLESDLKVESCWVYLHFIEYRGYSMKYDDYLEFCVRNRLNPVSDFDFCSAKDFLALQKHQTP